MIYIRRINIPTLSKGPGSSINPKALTLPSVVKRFIFEIKKPDSSLNTSTTGLFYFSITFQVEKLDLEERLERVHPFTGHQASRTFHLLGICPVVVESL